MMWKFCSSVLYQKMMQCSKSLMTATQLGTDASDGVVWFVVIIAVNLLVCHAPEICFWRWDSDHVIIVAAFAIRRWLFTLIRQQINNGGGSALEQGCHKTATPVFGFAPPAVWHNATKIGHYEWYITSLCRSKRFRIRNLLALKLMTRDDIFTFEIFINCWRDLTGMAA